MARKDPKMPVGIVSPPEWIGDKTLRQKLDDAIRKKYPDSPEVEELLQWAKRVDLAFDEITNF